MKIKNSLSLLSIAAVAAISASSCASVFTSAGVGALYTDMAEGQAVTSNALGSKVGTSKADNILGLVVTGDASVQAAAKEAGIKKISHVDSKKKSILGIIGSTTTVVYGE